MPLGSTNCPASVSPGGVTGRGPTIEVHGFAKRTDPDDRLVVPLISA